MSLALMTSLSAILPKLPEKGHDIKIDRPDLLAESYDLLEEGAILGRQAPDQFRLPRDSGKVFGFGSRNRLCRCRCSILRLESPDSPPDLLIAGLPLVRFDVPWRPLH